MNFEGNFKIIEDIDISAIRALITSFQEEWEINKSRQERYQLFHGDSKNIFITDIEATWDGIGYPLTHHHIDDQLVILTKPIVTHLENKLGGKVGKCLYINLPAGKKVKPHVDMGYYLNSIHRLHIPIKTHKEIYFSVGNETINMEEGVCYEINNTRQHSVDNNSSVDRIHLLLDIMPPHIFKKNESTPVNVISQRTA